MSFAVHLKLTQYCKSSILQLKKKGEREERGEEREERKLEREKKRKEERKSFVSTLVVWNRPWYIYTIISHGLSIYTMYLADAVYQFFHFFSCFPLKKWLLVIYQHSIGFIVHSAHMCEKIFEIALILNGVIGEFLCEWTIGFSSNSTLASRL